MYCVSHLKMHHLTTVDMVDICKPMHLILIDMLHSVPNWFQNCGLSDAPWEIIYVALFTAIANIILFYIYLVFTQTASRGRYTTSWNSQIHLFPVKRKGRVFSRNQCILYTETATIHGIAIKVIIRVEKQTFASESMHFQVFLTYFRPISLAS